MPSDFSFASGEAARALSLQSGLGNLFSDSVCSSICQGLHDALGNMKEIIMVYGAIKQKPKDEVGGRVEQDHRRDAMGVCLKLKGNRVRCQLWSPGKAV